MDEIERFDPNRNYTGGLQEFVQKGKQGDLECAVEKEGPDNRPEFRAKVKIKGWQWEGKQWEGSSRQEAKMSAAKADLEYIQSSCNKK